MSENNVSVQRPKNMYARSNSMNSDSSTHSPIESAHSPLRFHSPIRSGPGDPSEMPPFQSPDLSPIKYLHHPKANIAVDKHAPYTPSLAPSYQPRKVPDNGPMRKSPSLNRAMREDPPPSVTRVGPASVSGDKSTTSGATLLRRVKKEDFIRKASMGFRLSEVVLCLISFSVMAADKTPGWSGDSFERHKEYRYCLSVNVVGFVYSAFQAYDLAYLIAMGKRAIGHHLLYNFDFLMDQILAYLLISASSSAATRVDDWQSIWGKDEFTERASASVGMAFLAYIAFAFSSLISGYNLCTHNIS